MLRIAIPSSDSDLTFSTFEKYGLPAPPNGVDAEVNDNLVLKFEDEAEAITYAERLEMLSNGLNDKSSPQYRAIGDMIMAIRNDEFVVNYNEEN
ncbi:MAG: hypothetical protein NVSMB24_05300 [Mucilaginibacter sp.]